MQKENDHTVLSPRYWDAVYAGVKWRCALAVGIIAAFVTGSWLLIALLAKAEADAASIINKSGSQRMLSQRIALTSRLLAVTSDEQTRADARTALSDAVTEMASVHRALYQEGLASMSNDLQTLLFEEPVFLDQQVHTFLDLSNGFAGLAVENIAVDILESAQRIEQAASKLLPALQTAVSIHQDAAELRIRRLYVVGLVAGLLTILLLVVVTIALILPLLSRLRLAFVELKDAHDENAIQNRIIRDIAYKDPLTGLPNRAGFQLWMEQLSQQADSMHARCWLMLLDLDEFKQVNDSLGHPSGDELLRQVAARLSSCMGMNDHLARLGGDEFVVVSTGTQNQDYKSVLRTCLIETVAHPFSIHGQQIDISVSVGIASSSREGLDADELLRQADVALYRAKHRGGGVAQLFHESLDAEIRNRRSIECALRQACKGNEFRVVYQPQIDLHSGDIIGFEALLRWRHPDLGDIPPAQFVPVAEATGMIMPIALWLIREVCAQIKAWQERQLSSLVVAINISPTQLKQQDLDEQIARECRAFGVDPAQLEIEITESILANGNGKEISMVEKIKTLGVRLAIDDFGKGYSSLNRLKSFPIDRLKIDQSFIRDITSSAKDEAVNAAIVRLGQSIGVQVLAEGVESREQAETLAQLGCDQAQGFYYCPPLEVGQLENFKPMGTYSGQMMSLIEQ